MTVSATCPIAARAASPRHSLVAWPRGVPTLLLSFCMTLIVNGEPRNLPDGASVADLVRQLGLEKTACAVEVNRRLVPKADHGNRSLGNGDTIEVVTLVGGG